MAYHSTVGYFLVETINRIRHLLFSSYTTNDYSSLLNSSEQKCFKLLQKKIELDYPNWYVFPQVSVGEVLKAKDFNGYAITNSKRYDFLIVDHNFKPQIAIEYDGQGHYQGNYKDRDQAKEIATKKACIFFFRIGTKGSIKDQIDNIFHQLPTTFGKTNNTAG